MSDLTCLHPDAGLIAVCGEFDATKRGGAAVSANLNGRMPPRQRKGMRVASIQPAFQSAGGVALRSASVLRHPSFLGQTEREQSVDTRARHVPNPAITTPTRPGPNSRVTGRHFDGLTAIGWQAVSLVRP